MDPQDAAPDDAWAKLRERVGLRPIVDACLPPLAFVAAFAYRGNAAGIVAAVGTAALVVGYRGVRREGVRPALVALLVLLLAAMLVRRTGQGVNLFLPDLLGNAALVIWFATSLIVRRPATATVLRALGIRVADLRTDPGLRRGHLRATALWLALWSTHLSIEVPLYLAKDTLALAVVRIVLGPPMWLPVGWLGWRVIKRSGG